MIKAVVFDLDDTLISEKEYIKSGFKAISKIIKDKYKLYINEYDIYEELLELSSNNAKNVFNRFLDGHKIQYKQEDIKLLINIYRNHEPNIKLYDDAQMVIAKLKEKNIKIGIITDGYSVSQKAKLKAIDAYNIFDHIIITDELGKEFWKPHPKSFEMMKEKFEIEFTEMIYIGDNPEKDFFIRSIYPINTVRIIRNENIYYNKTYLKDVKELYRIKYLSEIVEIINEA